MKRLFLLALPALLVSTPALAEVDPKIHRLCIEAKDYAGCVKAMKGETTSVKTSDNSCPHGFAYVGTNDSCQRVDCKYSWWMSAGGRRHSEIVAGKSKWECPDRWVLGTLHKGVLTLNEISPLINNPDCPPNRPKIGWNSSCETVPSNWKELEEAKKPKCNFKLKAYGCSYDAYLVANPAMKKWAVLNPEMAENERARLQSVD